MVQRKRKNLQVHQRMHYDCTSVSLPTKFVVHRQIPLVGVQFSISAGNSNLAGEYIGSKFKQLFSRSEMCCK